ncbi:hypothetical protein WR25_01323 [Diploscapter pachys]|uniref:Uncharacterized protein n=1 Tax=Diploscapter pachys TaxID=2018661 RepID=A0A2A2M2N7_9BILA|nr:hypothetical protein WR25_01323 [Diploscapter pachys]
MFTNDSTIGTADACHVASVAAHFRLSAQQISVKTAIARISHDIGLLLCGLGQMGRRRKPVKRRTSEKKVLPRQGGPG